MTLAGRVAVVTGAGRGIGAATARALAGAGCAVVLAARSRDQIDRVAGALQAEGHRAVPVATDVTSEESVQHLAHEASKLGPVAVLVNNAGAASSMPLARTTLQEWNRLMATNATGAFLCTRAFVPGMMERKWGRVVNVASIAGLRGGKYLAAYSAAKHAMMGLTRSTADETASSGVTANAVCPGFVDTEMTRETVDRIVAKTGLSRQEALAAALASTGQARLITAEEVAEAVLSLVGDRPTPPNGEVLVLDGGVPMTNRYEIINPETLGVPRGWNNGMLVRAGGKMLFIAGQTAVDKTGAVPPEGGFVEQFERALEHVLSVLRQAGGQPADIGRFTIYVTDVARYRSSLKPLGAAYRRLMGNHYPAMALVEVKSLVDERALVEIEATAVVG